MQDFKEIQYTYIHYVLPHSSLSLSFSLSLSLSPHTLILTSHMYSGRTELGDITPHNIKQLKKLNSVVFPITYTDKVCIKLHVTV